MGDAERRTVGERGQITIPKRLREKFGIEGGDEVVVREDDGRLVIERPVTEELLAEGYRERAERDARIASELSDVSAEADDELGDAPDW